MSCLDAEIVLKLPNENVASVLELLPVTEANMIVLVNIYKKRMSDGRVRCDTGTTHQQYIQFSPSLPPEIYEPAIGHQFLVSPSFVIVGIGPASLIPAPL